jgi:hypothetical protein
MADGEDIQPLVCDNGTGMVKVRNCILYQGYIFPPMQLYQFEVVFNFAGWVCR